MSNLAGISKSSCVKAFSPSPHISTITLKLLIMRIIIDTFLASKNLVTLVTVFLVIKGLKFGYTR